MFHVEVGLALLTASHRLRRLGIHHNSPHDTEEGGRCGDSTCEGENRGDCEPWTFQNADAPSGLPGAKLHFILIYTSNSRFTITQLMANKREHLAK